MRYRVKTLGSGGSVAEHSFEADTPMQAGGLARARGLSVVSVTRELSPAAWLAPRRANFPLLLFAQQFIALLDAGLGTVEALEAMADEDQAGTGSVVMQVLRHVQAGRSLSYSLEQMSATFPPLFIATIRASERTGDLKEALARYVDYHRRIDQLRRKVINASIYPALLLASGVLVTGFLMFYVVPRFGRIYEDIGGQLPFLSQLLMQWGQLLGAHAWGVLASLFGGGLLAAYALSRPAFRAWVRERLWSVPRVGQVLRIYQLARFYRTIGMLLRSGTPLVTALDMSESMLDPTMRPMLQSGRRAISEGHAASVALSEHGLTTPIALSMLRVGERTGELGAMADRVASLYDDELERWVETGTRLFEPLLMAAIGVVIGVIVVLLYMPVFELASSLN